MISTNIYTLTLSLGYKKEYSLSSGDLAMTEKKTSFNLKQNDKVNYSKENDNMRFLLLHSRSSSYNSSQSRSCKGKIISFKYIKTIPPEAEVGCVLVAGGGGGICKIGALSSIISLPVIIFP